MTDARYWEERYARGDTPWDKSRAAPPLVEIAERGFVSGRTLVPGCGPGHDAAWLAGLPGVSVTALDIASRAVGTARGLHGAKGLPLTFEVADFFALPASHAGAFDTLVEHTCLCAIDPAMRGDYAAAAARALRSGGLFAGIFFVNPDAGEGPPFRISREEIDALFSPAFEHVASWTPAGAFPGRENRERIGILRRR